MLKACALFGTWAFGSWRFNWIQRLLSKFSLRQIPRITNTWRWLLNSATYRHEIGRLGSSMSTEKRMFLRTILPASAILNLLAASKLAFKVAY
ncbi:hypothetical protein LINGRAHAP2_LOCUS1491 [Linum grandiflorum]